MEEDGRGDVHLTPPILFAPDALSQALLDVGLAQWATTALVAAREQSGMIDVGDR